MTRSSITERPDLRDVLPSHFLHGYASAAYQIEGATQKDGRGLCNWDKFLQESADTGDDACRSYDLWQQDVKLLKQAGAKSYRFSISWSRVKPLGGADDAVSEKGLRYYDNLINGLITAGIEPTVTLHHYDTPLAPDQRYRGFAASDPRQLIRDFVAYAELCFERYGDRVKRWLTINEPWIYCSICADGLVPDYSPKDFFRVGHNCLLVHGNVARLYRERFQKSQKGQIGIASNYDWVEPIDDTAEAEHAARIAEQRSLGWWALPIFNGIQIDAWDQYGDVFPKLSDEELEMVHGSADFFSINHYGTMWATGKLIEPYKASNFRDLDDVEKTHYKSGKAIGRRGENGHPHTVPWGFKNMLVHVWQTYAKATKLDIYVYENGYAVEHEADLPLHEILDDKHRQEYYLLYISALCEAVRDHGVQMAGYHCWSLLDNLEWNFGFRPRFGLTYVDREDGYKRIPKDSMKVVKDIWNHVIAPA